MRLKMKEDIKLLIALLCMSIISAFLRFKSFAQFVSDAILGFSLGYSCYLLLSYWIADGAVRGGFVGIIILESRPLYDWMECFIKTKLSDMIVKKK